MNDQELRLKLAVYSGLYADARGIEDGNAMGDAVDQLELLVRQAQLAILDQVRMEEYKIIGSTQLNQRIDDLQATLKGEQDE